MCQWSPASAPSPHSVSHPPPRQELEELSVFLEQRRQFIQRAHEKSQKEVETRLKAELEAAKKVGLGPCPPF